MAVLLCCQVNRNGTGKPKLDNLKESGSIEEDSDNVILLHRIPEEDMMSGGWDSDRRPMLLDLAKQRDGSTGEVNSIFIASKFTFLRSGGLSMTNSRQKGARGERELAAVLREHGFECRRGQQYSGANGDADVVGLPGIHIECKRVESLNIHKAIEQAKSDARENELPAVFHRKNGKPWLVTMTLEDWMKIFKGENNESI